MTLSLERPTTSYTPGDEALDIINHHRESIKERFCVEEIGDEFPSLSRELGAHSIYLARAGDNRAGAFKVRGAFVGAKKLKEEGATSLIVPSAGNHARGAVLAANAFDMDVHVVVPTTAPHAKKEGLHELDDSGKLHLHTKGESFEGAYGWATNNPQLGHLLHPYNNPNVIAGQGTLVDDILHVQQVRNIVVPVGGGGLLAGVLQRLNELGRSDVLVHAVEAEGSNSLSRSLAEKTVTEAEQPNTKYGGSAVRHIGSRALEICRRSQNLRLHAATDEAVERVTDNYWYDRTMLERTATPNYEPTTLVALAGLYTVTRTNPHERTVVIGTGHNDSLYPAPQPRKTLVSAGTFLR